MGLYEGLSLHTTLVNLVNDHSSRKLDRGNHRDIHMRRNYTRLDLKTHSVNVTYFSLEPYFIEHIMITTNTVIPRISPKFLSLSFP